MFMIFGTLIYLALNGHLMLLGALAESFRSLPIGAAHVDGSFLLAVVLWGARVFEAGLLIALPAVISLVIVNLALGVVTRAAPQLNLFGIGFTITLMCGFFVLIAGLDGIMSGITDLLNSALMAVSELIGTSAAGVR
jgi:flagellar biosynthetic protein FliR